MMTLAGIAGKKLYDTSEPYIDALKYNIDLYNEYHNQRLNDKYKHSLINCLMTQKGKEGEEVVKFLAGLKEKKDVLLGDNTQQESDEDNEANIYGRTVAKQYPDQDCKILVSKRYPPK